MTEMKNMQIKDGLLSKVANYYTAKVAKYGDTPMGVDWNNEEGQMLRFEQLLKVVRNTGKFSIHDLGCGYGAMFGYMGRRFQDFTYTGCDLSPEMVARANERYGDNPKASFVVGAEPPGIADYAVASGIFNVRLNHSVGEWMGYLESTLDNLDRTSKHGFAFNCLTSYSDKEKMRDDLFYADPCKLFDLCKHQYSRHVALLHDYGLYEFTIIVRKGE